MVLVQRNMMITKGLTLQKNLVEGYLWLHLKRTFGQNFRELQKRSGKTGVEIANELKVGPPLIAGWRNDRAGLPETPTLFRIAKVLHCTVDELLQGIDPEYDSIRRDLIRQYGDKGSTLSSERGADVPASGKTDSGRIEQLERALASAREIAHRALKLLEQSGIPDEDRSTAESEARLRRRNRKTG